MLDFMSGQRACDSANGPWRTQVFAPLGFRFVGNVRHESYPGIATAVVIKNKPQCEPSVRAYFKQTLSASWVKIAQNLYWGAFPTSQQIRGLVSQSDGT